ncbi:MAG: Uma2 family endonuclease [Cyanobacteria bacterium P01_D01_bin.123]
MTIERFQCSLDVTWPYGWPISLDFKPLLTWTDENFVALCRANPALNFEVTVDGILLIVPPVGGSAGRREAEAIGQLANWNGETDLGEVYSSQTMFCLPNGAKRMPDTSWVSRSSRLELLSQTDPDAFLSLAPDFVIELRSPSDELKTLQEKMREYIEAGVRLGWLIDPQNQMVEIYRESDRKVEVLDAPTELSGEEVLPGFSFSTARLF